MSYGTISGEILFIAIVFLSIKLVLSLIPANIANKKGYGFAGFFLLGFFFFLIGLIVALCLDDKNIQANQMQNAIYSMNSANMRYVPNSSDELIKYNTLFQQGAITKEEYDILKDKIIGENSYNKNN